MMAGSRMSAEGTATGQLQRACLSQLRQHEADGTLSTSVRFIYYELEQAGYPLPENVQRPDNCVIAAVTVLREAELVPWWWIADETRTVEGPHLAGAVTSWVRDVLDEARIDPWPPGQRPLVICESRGVRAALRDTAWRYAARITSVNGQCNGFLRTQIAPLVTEKTPVAYFGDHNPAGTDIEANTRGVLARCVVPELISVVPELAVPGPLPVTLDWERLAITPEQAAGADPPLPPKPGTDRRYKDGRPHDSYEAEALGQRALIRLLEDWLERRLPEPLDDVLAREEEQRARVRRLLEESGLT